VGQLSLSPIGSIVLCLLAVAPAVAGRYDLVKGKGVEVCEAYEKNLNSFKPRLPFRGQRPVNPEFKDFSKPDLKGSYEDPSPENPRSFPAEKIDRFLWERDANPIYQFPVTEWPKWRGTPEQYERAWKSFRTRKGPGHNIGNQGDLVGLVDIDNDGTPDNIYLDRWGEVTGPLLVLNADRSDLDYEKTKLTMQHPSRKEQGMGEFRPLAKDAPDYHPHKKFGRTWVEDSLYGAGYDVFQYKSRTYFDLWWIRHPDHQGKLDFQVGKPLRVFIIENNKTREICTYKYID